MKAVKKLLAACLLICATGFSVFAQNSTKNLQNLLERIAKRENSGELVNTNDRFKSSSDGEYLYVASDSNLFLVESGNDLPYQYIRFSDSNDKGFIYLTYCSKDSYYAQFMSEQQKIKDGESAKEFLATIPELQEMVGSFANSEEVSTYSVNLKGKTYTVFCNNMDEPVSFAGLETGTDAEESGDIASETSDGSPTKSQLKALLNHILEMEKSGELLASTDCTGVSTDKYCYISDGKNRFLIEADWDFPYEYNLMLSNVEGLPNILYVSYGHDEDRLGYTMSISALKDNHIEDFFEIDYEEAYKTVCGFTISYRDEVVINGTTYEVFFSDINDDWDEPEYDERSDSYAQKELERPTQEQMDALLNHIVELEESGELVDTKFKGIGNDEYAYISDGKNLYLIDSTYELPFEYNRVISDDEEIPNIIYASYGLDDDFYHGIYSSNKVSVTGYDAPEDFFDVDIKEAYSQLLSYPISYRNSVTINGVEYQVYFVFCGIIERSEFDDDCFDDEYDDYDDEYEYEDYYDYYDDEYEYDDYEYDDYYDDDYEYDDYYDYYDDEYEYDDYEYDDDCRCGDDEYEYDDERDVIQDNPNYNYYENDSVVSPLNKEELQTLLNKIVGEMNGKGYPSLYKTDKPYAILEQEGRYILRSENYSTHLDLTGDYICTVQLYTCDCETGLLVFGFTQNNSESLYYFTMLGEQQVDEDAIIDAHMSGDLIVTQMDIDEFMNNINDNGYVYDTEVTVDGILYHAYCIPMLPADWDE